MGAIKDVTEAVRDALGNFLFSPIVDREVRAMKSMVRSILIARYPEVDERKIRVDVRTDGDNRLSVSPGNAYTKKLFYGLTIEPQMV